MSVGLFETFMKPRNMSGGDFLIRLFLFWLNFDLFFA